MLLSEEAFTTVKFIRDYVSGNQFDGLRSCRKGEYLDVKVWLARELMVLGYVVWQRGVF
jgi:hypothetical protein